MVITSIFEHLFVGDNSVIVPLVSVILIITILTAIIVKRQRKVNMARARLALIEEITSRKLKESFDAKADINQLKEYDTVSRECEIYFAHTSLKGIGKYVTDNNLPKFLENAVTASHWSIVFMFSAYKQMICEPKVNNNDNPSFARLGLVFGKDNLVRAVYRQFDSEDAQKFVTLIHIDTMIFSPSDVFQNIKTHPMNGIIYNANGNLCQEWIIKLSYQLGFHHKLLEIVEAKRTEYYGVNILVDITRERILKPGGNKKTIIRFEGKPFKKIGFRFNPIKIGVEKML
jgi:hypothetical protein